jgi:hypothetical protein
MKISRAIVLLAISLTFCSPSKTAAQSGSITFEIHQAAVPDTTPPSITNVLHSGITYTGATISWTTNELSDSLVEYGTTPSYGSTASDSSMVLSHAVTLSGLNSSTTYYYRVKSKDASNNTGISGGYSFTTPTIPDTTPPSITNVLHSGITYTGATISWTTNELSDSLVEYGTTPSYGSTALDSSMVLSHSVTLSGLNPSTTYHYRVKSWDAAGNMGVSSDDVFTTESVGYPQPTSLSYSASSGFAGIDSYYVTVGNGSGMTVNLKYNFTPWNSTTVSDYDLVEPIGPMDSAGTLTRVLNRSALPGTYTVTAIRNTLNAEWVAITPISYTIRPPKPTSLSVVDWFSVVVGNGQNQAVYLNVMVASPEGFGIANWLVYLDANGAWGIPVPPGMSIYVAGVRNYLDEGDDAWLWLSY